MGCWDEMSLPALIQPHIPTSHTYWCWITTLIHFCFHQTAQKLIHLRKATWFLFWFIWLPISSLSNVLPATFRIDPHSLPHSAHSTSQMKVPQSSPFSPLYVTDDPLSAGSIVDFSSGSGLWCTLSWGVSRHPSHVISSIGIPGPWPAKKLIMLIISALNQAIWWENLWNRL